MHKVKRGLQMILILGVVVVGIYMLCNHSWGTPPAISGLGFLMAGLAMWIPYCPICKMIFKE